MPFRQAVLLHPISISSRIANKQMFNKKFKTMKKLYSMFLAATLLIGAANMKAQNRCILTENKTFVSEVQVSDNQTVRKVNEQQLIATTNPERNLVLTEGKAVYTLTIAPNGVWDVIIVNNDDGFEDYCYSWMTDFYQSEVSEGFYDIMILGRNAEGEPANLVYDQLEVNSDTNFTPSMSEAVYTIVLNVLGENGNPINEIPVVNDTVHITYNFVMSHGSMTGTGFGLANKNHIEIATRFNNFGDRSRLYAHVTFITTQQKLYNIQLPTIAEGITGDLVLSNNPEELTVHEEYYNVNTNNACIGYDDRHFGPRPDTWFQSLGCLLGYTYNPSEPLTVITNTTNNNDPIVGNGSNIKYAFAPMIFESRWDADIYKYWDVVAPCGISLNSEGYMIREPFDPDLSYFPLGILPASFPAIPATPVMYVYEPTKNLSFGYRTPLLFNYLSFNYNAETSPFGMALFGGWMSYMGENGVQRRKDEDRTLKITYNGETYFEDSLYLANTVMLMNFADPAAVAYDIVNDNVVVDGIAKTNITHIEFDMNRNDALPPTLNLLQVMDAYNEEVITVEDLEHSRINFAGGDFHVDLENGKMAYDDEAIIEVFYKTENSEYQSLEFEEKPEMFHINYGNYYEIPLSQLVGEVLNQWVTVKFVLSDIAGNSQTQELFNLFYVDDQTTICENQGLQHAVCPNPFTNEVKVTAAQAVNGMANIVVYNVLGEQVYNKAENCTETQDFTIDGSAWKSGIYFYSISTENGVLLGKIVKE